MAKVKWIDCWKEDNIKCPYCGNIYDDTTIRVKSYNPTYLDLECPHCGKTFGMMTHITVHFTTVRKEGDIYCEEWDDDDD